MSRPLPAFLEGLVNKCHRPGPYEASAEAKALHATLTVVDLHADPLMWGRNLLVRNAVGHVDIPRLIEGGVSLQTFSTVTHSPLGINIKRNRTDAPDMIYALAWACDWPEAARSSRLERALFQARVLRTAVMESGGRMSQVLTKEDLAEMVAVRRPGKTAALLSIEGAQCLDGHLEAVDALHAAGVRMVGLTHFVDNEVGGSASGQDKYGLTDYGRDVLERLEWKKVAVDLAHASPKLYDDVLKLGKTAPLVSHTGACAACPNERNLTDAQIKAVADKGGVIGVGYWKTATGGDDAAAIARTVRAVVNAGGLSCAALGSDFDGAVPTPFDATGIPLVTQALLEAKFTEAEIRAVMGANALRYLSERLPTRA